ncbi:hypothetical protein TNCT_585671 [Trichonephila clavata]|uniref:Uncharacterized protein n=1 Tax=Trichonephila clavata TaxID=2740835 RepID=A0A8X6L6D9_TRICU|nr:hypothetical protein TNCT_585671 [Trichonephila clavata]
MGDKQLTNRIILSQTDIPKLIEASDSEEVTEYESHTSDGTESSDNDFDTKGTEILNYIPKKSKNVILMSTLHRGKEVSNTPDKKTINDLRL